MKIDVDKQISELLFEKDTLIVPGLGAFVSNYKPAYIDHVQGQIHPPSKTISFNSRIVTDDGVLSDQLIKQYDISEDQAEEAIFNYVEKLAKALDEREIVVIPKLGRLYKDYEHRLQFLQDSTNLNQDVFGLPVLKYYPILRQRALVPVAAPMEEREPTSKKKKNKWFSGLFPFILGFAIIAGGVGIYLYQLDRNASPETDTENLPPDYHLNKKPTSTKADPSPSLLEEKSPAEESDLTLDDSDSGAEKETEEPTLAPTQRECIIIAGQFSKREGARNWAKKLLEEGFNPYTDRNRRTGMMRVGIRFIYEDPNEVEVALRYLKENFDSTAFVLKE